ncbi:MAG: flavin reductase family protein [Arenicellales bacterium]
MEVDFSSLTATQAYHLMTQSIVPRPIAWVLTENATASATASNQTSFNLAPFSYFNAVASAPPMVMFSIGVKPDGRIKDTLNNIQRTQTMVIHIASDAQIHALNQSAASLDYGDSEIEQLGLNTQPFEGFSLPRLSDCPIALGCELDHFHTLKNSDQTLVFAQITCAHYSDDIASAHPDKQGKPRIKIDADALRPLSRLGGIQYADFSQTISLKRPD